MAATILGILALLLALGLAGVLALLWRLHSEGARRADMALALLEKERARGAAESAALRRYEVTFASVSGRGELGERVLIDTARALGLREGLHYSVQTDVAGGGSVRPDLLLLLGEDRRVPVDAKTSLACWAEAVETDDPAERRDALRVHCRNIRSRGNELAGKSYQRWADAIYGTIMFVPSDAAVVAALDSDPELLRWLLDRRVFLCGPTGFAIAASAALFTASERALAEDVDVLRDHALRAHRAAGTAVDVVNVSSTHLQRFVAARRRELEALEGLRSAVAPLTEVSGSPAPLPMIRREMENTELAAFGGHAQTGAAES
ncbi:MAG: DNA recombination protein RmuC [Sciscionella sp.]